VSTKRERMAKSIQEQIDESSAPATCACGQMFMSAEEYLNHMDGCGVAVQAGGAPDDKD
jgi:hypothetical protein